MTKSLTMKEKTDRISLYRSQNIGPIAFKALIARFGNAGEALYNLPDISRRGGNQKKLAICDAAKARKELDDIDAAGGVTLFTNDEHYPKELTRIADPPPFLHVLGYTPLLLKSSVAIVGSRNASTHNMEIAAKLAEELGKKDYLITSGMARGIDRAAHQGAQTTGSAAILGCGINVIYPKENADIYEYLSKLGCVISEFPPDEKPVPQNFPRRNRIISGMSLAVIVAEATKKSGSLITARYALDQGRQLFAVPGSPADKRSEGTNQLIRDGADMVTNSYDVINKLVSLAGLEETSIPFTPPEKISTPDQDVLDDGREILFNLISLTPTPVDHLVKYSGFTINIVNALLVELEIAGRITRMIGNMVATRHNNFDQQEQLF